MIVYYNNNKKFFKFFHKKKRWIKSFVSTQEIQLKNFNENVTN